VFTKIAILGPGLLGASLLQATRKRHPNIHLATWSRRAETRQHCALQPWCDSIHDTPAGCVRDAALVVICVPVDKTAEVLAATVPSLPPDALVTDVGSTKAAPCAAARATLPPPITFIGSHPMAGSEKSGLEHATPHLFENRTCILTPTETTPPNALETLERYWQSLGMKTITTTPETHDTIVAHTSHLPHILAAALASTLQRATPSEWQSLSGPGLRDTTRIAAGDPALWRAIATTNRTALLHAIEIYQSELESYRNTLANNDDDALESRLQCAKTWRDQLENTSQTHSQKNGMNGEKRG
jgi:prephenate dehydrogenase